MIFNVIFRAKVINCTRISKKDLFIAIKIIKLKNKIMKPRLFTRLFVFMLVMSSFGLQAQFDDLYYDYRKDEGIGKKTSTVSYNDDYRNEDESYQDEYDNDEYSNYDEYAYSSRIRRFHQPVVTSRYYSSFDSWWYDDYYNDSYYGYNGNNSVNIFIGSSFGNWNRPWGFNSWNNWNNGWGYNSWNTWNRPWGWNSWNSCPNYGWGNNIYYGNVFYGNNWNGNNNWNNNGWNNWNNGYESSNKSYGSRKGGSLTSSVKGRNASPRREVVSGGNGTSGDRVGLTKEDGVTSSRIKRDDKDYKGDIRKRDANGVEPKKSERSRIYTNPDRNTSPNSTSPSRNNDSSRERRSTEPADKSRRESGSTTPTESGRNRGNIDSSQRRSTNESTRSNRSEDNTGSNRNSSGNSWDSGSSSRSSGSSNMGTSRSSSSGSGSSGSSSRSGGGSGSSSRRGGG